MCPIDYICSTSSISIVIIMDLSCIFDDVIEFETLIRWYFLLIVSFRVAEEKLFLLFFSFYKIFSHLFTHQFWKINIFLPVSKERYFPLSFFFIPLRVVDNMINLIWIHKNVKNCWKLFDLFFLVSDRIKQLLFLIFMLILYISQFSQVSNIFLFNLCKSFLNFVYLLVKIFVILFYM